MSSIFFSYLTYFQYFGSDRRSVSKIPDKHREFSHSLEGWNPVYKDIPGFCKAVKTEEIAAQNHILTPGRYVGMAPRENEDSEPYADKMKRLTTELYAQFEESARLEKEIKANLAKLGFGEEE